MKKLKGYITIRFLEDVTIDDVGKENKNLNWLCDSIENVYVLKDKGNFVVVQLDDNSTITLNKKQFVKIEDKDDDNDYINDDEILYDDNLFN